MPQDATPSALLTQGCSAGWGLSCWLQEQALPRSPGLSLPTLPLSLPSLLSSELGEGGGVADPNSSLETPRPKCPQLPTSLSGAEETDEGPCCLGPTLPPLLRGPCHSPLSTLPRLCKYLCLAPAPGQNSGACGGETSVGGGARGDGATRGCREPAVTLAMWEAERSQGGPHPSPAGTGGSRGVTHSCVRTTTSSREKTTATARPRSRFSRMVATKVTSQMSYKQRVAVRLRRGHWGGRPLIRPGAPRPHQIHTICCPEGAYVCELQQHAL